MFSIEPQQAIYLLDLFGTASFAFSGALSALKRRPDIVGMMICAGATAVGGGMVRDVMLDRQVTMLHNIAYPLTIMATVIVTALFPKRVYRNETLIKYFDAIGLGVFSAIGASLAAEQGLNWLSVLFIACITGAGGGVIRDVLLNRMPLVLYSEVYISAVAAGAMVLLLGKWAGLEQLPCFLLAWGIATVLRILAIRYHWQLPRIGQKTSG